MTPQRSASTQDRPRVAVFVRHPLAWRAPLLQHQLRGLSERYEPIVFETDRGRDEILPFEAQPLKDTGFVRRRIALLLERATGRVAPLSREQRRQWLAIARSQDIELLHAHSAPAALIALPLARSLRVPLLVTLQPGDASSRPRSVAWRSSLCELLDYAHVCVAWRHQVECLIDCGAERTRTVVHHLGISAREIPLASRPGVSHKVARGQPIRFLKIAPFIEESGHRYTFEAFRLFLGAYPKSELRLLGRGGLEARCQARARRLGIGDRVRFLGEASVQAVAAETAAADVFLNHRVYSESGDSEQAALLILRAMASGLPVVASACPSVSEVVVQGVNGALVPARDVQAYATRLREVLGWGADLGEAARRTVVDHFDADRQAALLCDLYAGLLSS